MKVSLIQMNSVSDKQANLDAARKLIEQAVARGEWRIDDIGVAAGVVRDAAMVFVHPAFVAQLVTAGAPAEDMLRATVTTLVRAFESGVRYGHLANGRR